MEMAGRSALIQKLSLIIFIPLVLMAAVFSVFRTFGNNELKSEDLSEKILGVETKNDISGYEIEIDKASLVGQEEIELAYEYPSIMSEVFMQEGLQVGEGITILKLDVKEMELQKSQLEAVLVQARANLQKIGAGATKEDIEISKTMINETKDSLDGAKNAVIDALRGGFTACDDAVSAKTNALFTDPAGDNPQLSFTPAPASLESIIESKRREANGKLESLVDQINDLDLDSDFEEEMDDARELLEDVQNYLDSVAQAVNLLTSGDVSQDIIDAWKTLISAGRLEVEESKKNINEAYAVLRAAQGSYSLSEKELELKEALARQEDVTIAQAKVNEVQGQIAVLDERIRKATISAPFDGKIMKIWYKEGELVPAYQKIVSLSSSQTRVSADVIEDDIKKIKPGKKVRIKFRAMPEKTFSGTVSSTEPQRILIDGDVYYRTYISIDDPDPDLMEGMTADIYVKSE